MSEYVLLYFFVSGAVVGFTVAKVPMKNRMTVSEHTVLCLCSSVLWPLAAMVLYEHYKGIDR